MDAYSQQRKSVESVSHSEAELCINAWYFVDESGIVMRLAAKLYALRGTDQEKLQVLRNLAATEHITAKMGKVPSNFKVVMSDGALEGAVTQAHVQSDPVPIFNQLFSEIEEELPDLIVSVNNEYQVNRMQLKEPLLWVCTPVLESEDGRLLAQVS